jgi:hypothetical protein
MALPYDPLAPIELSTPLTTWFKPARCITLGYKAKGHASRFKMGGALPTSAQ